MMMGQRISTAADFSRVAVYRRDSADGPVMTVAFDNPEFGGWKQIVLAIVAGALFVTLFPAMVYFGQAAESLGVSWVFGAAIVAAVFAGLLMRARRPWKVGRAIELDFGRDRLGILKDGRVERELQLSRLANQTVDEHPEAELGRVNRQMKGEKSPRLAEKQHCLFGWFGAGGGDQVVLITRAEYPSRNSLFEVRQAMLWAMEQGGNAAMASQAQSAPRIGGGIKPPLD